MKLVFGGLLRQIVRNLHKLFGRKRVSDLLRNLGQRLLRFAADRNRQRRKAARQHGDHAVDGGHADLAALDGRQRAADRLDGASGRFGAAFP